MTTYNTSTILSTFTLMLEGPIGTTPARSLGTTLEGPSFCLPPGMEEEVLDKNTHVIHPE